MKKAFISLLALLMMGNAYAADTFTVDNVTLPQNGEADVTVRFSLDQGHTCSGYTFWLKVPEDLAFVTTTVTTTSGTETEVVYTQGDSYGEGKVPTITPNLSEGYLKVACMTAGSTPLNQQTGVLVTFRIKAVGTPTLNRVYDCTLTHATISAENGSVSNVADGTFTVTISEPVDPRTILDETSTTAPSAATNVDVRVKRTINANEWSTICLPFAMTAAQVQAAFNNGDVQLLGLAKFKGWEATEFDAKDNTTAIEVTFEDVNAIAANTPYIIKVSKAITEFTADGVDIDPDDEPCVTVGKMNRGTFGSFTGSYVPVTIDAECLFLSGNKFWYSTGQTKMKGYRAYFYFQDVVADYYDSAGATTRISMRFDSGVATGIAGIAGSRQETGSTYDLQGRKIAKPIGKGLYIRDGKKIVK